MNDLSNSIVLLVDDTKTNIDVLVQALRGYHRLGVALNGADALSFAREKTPDLILLDIMMPGMDGFEVCQALKADTATRDIPVIFITAMDDLRHKTRGFEFGAVDYITKPFDVTEVRARVKTHLTLKHAQEILKDQNTILERMVAEQTLELKMTQIEIIDRLGMAAEFRDTDTGLHIKRMSKFCRLMGKQMGMPSERYDTLDLASTMHDVGKIGISDTILLKPGRLSDEEWVAMRTHSAIGAKLLSGSNSPLLNVAREIADTHHERWDGSGYHRGLKGEEIPLFGRITCLCDVFDALISVRPYKEAWTFENAIAEIQAGSGTFFDPELVELFMKLSPELREIASRYS
jgi:putative two-component system response regulator